MCIIVDFGIPIEKFRGSEHFFWDYILNTRQANEMRVDHKKSPENPFFSFFHKILDKDDYK